MTPRQTLRQYYRCDGIVAVLDGKPAPPALVRFAKQHRYRLRCIDAAAFSSNDVTLGCFFIFFGKEPPPVFREALAYWRALFARDPLQDRPTLAGDTIAARFAWAKTKIAALPAAFDPPTLQSAESLGAFSLGTGSLARVLTRFLALPSSKDSPTSVEAPRRLKDKAVASYVKASKQARSVQAVIYGDKHQETPVHRRKNLPFPSGAAMQVSVPTNLRPLAKQFRMRGYCVLEQAFQTDALLRYVGDLVAANGGASADFIFRDDHVFRRLNRSLTPLAAKLVGAPLTTCGVSNCNWYGTGAGFGAHHDGSPYFDVSLSIMLGPHDVEHRVVLVSRAGEVEVVTRAGDAVFFVGSELLHFGPSFEPGQAHAVAVLPWTYVRR